MDVRRQEERGGLSSVSGEGQGSAGGRRQPPLPPPPTTGASWRQGGDPRPPRLSPPAPPGASGPATEGGPRGLWPPPPSFQLPGDWSPNDGPIAWSPPTRRSGVGALVGALVLALVAALVGAGIGAAVAHRSQSRSGPSDFALFPPTDGGVRPNSEQADIAAKVDPAVVDVNSTLGLENGAAAGTGMVITSSGEVLTNNHVVDGATKVSVQINGSGPMYTAKVLGTDATDDVALLQIQGVSGLRTVKLGDSTKVGVGDRVVAIGNALGLQGPPSVSGARPIRHRQ
jgi:hypothetical protein